MSKNYAVINTATQILVEIVEVSDESASPLSRPDGFEIRQLDAPGPGVPRVYPGMLFHGGRFWAPVFPRRTPEEERAATATLSAEKN